MPVYQFDPLQDQRWNCFLHCHPKATAFHTAAWLKAVCQTYGYQCFGLTVGKQGSELKNGMVICRIRSWLTGSRLVSVPFADHCDPLVNNAEELHSMLDWLARESIRADLKYVEIRPLDRHMVPDGSSHFQQGDEFRIHLLDLRPSTEQIFQSFDKHSVQRRFKKVEKNLLNYEAGNSEELLKKFYHLMVLTRRRHRVPPQPLAWYRNLLGAFGEQATIRVILLGETPVASMFTLSYGNSMIYKYGCSDERYNKWAGNACLFWRAIRDAKETGKNEFDMGRSDLDNSGLIKFKSNWGTVNSALTYWRFPEVSAARRSGASSVRAIGGTILSHLPDRWLVAVGTALYKHAG